MKHKYTLLIYTENHVGLLNRISIIFTRHKVNIESLNTSPSMHPGLHSFVITINTTADKAEHLRKNIEKQVEVYKAFLYGENEVFEQAIALFKIGTKERQVNFPLIEQIIRSSNARIMSMESDFIVIEKTDKQQEIDELLDQLSVLDVREFIQSGRVVVTKPMGKLTDFLKKLEAQEER